MSSTILFGAYAGLGSGAIIMFLSHIAPMFGAGNFIRDIDQPTAFGRELSRREAHLVGILVHLITSLFYGALFAFGVERGWASGFHFLPILGWCVIILLFNGFILMPIEGHGLFGVKADAWFPVDLLLTNVLWGLFYLMLIRLWLPV